MLMILILGNLALGILIYNEFHSIAGKDLHLWQMIIIFMKIYFNYLLDQVAAYNVAICSRLS